MAVRYEAYTWTGVRVTGVLPVDSAEAAEDALREDQLIPYRVAKVHPRPSLVRLMPGLFRPAEQEIIDFTRQLAALLRSGIPLRPATSSLRDGIRSLGLREALRQVMGDIDAGMSFSVACARHPTVFPGFYTRMLHVAEATGETSLMLEQLAQLLERRKRLKDQIRRALTYPAIALGVAAAAGFVLVTYSLPALLGLLAEFGGELPPTTRLLMGIAQFLRAYGGYGIGLILLVTTVVWLYGRTRRGAVLRDRVLLRTPVLKRVILLSNMFSLMSTLGTLLRGGVASVESLRLAGREVGNAVVRGGMNQVATAVTAGRRLSDAIADVAIFPPLVAQAMRSGEAAGTLTQVVESLTEYFEKELDRAVSSAVEMIQPVAILFVAAVVGFVAVAVLSGIYSTLGSIA